MRQRQRSFYSAKVNICFASNTFKPHLNSPFPPYIFGLPKHSARRWTVSKWYVTNAFQNIWCPPNKSISLEKDATALYNTYLYDCTWNLILYYFKKSKSLFLTHPRSLKGTSNSTCPCVIPSTLSIKFLKTDLSLCLNSRSACKCV